MPQNTWYSTAVSLCDGAKRPLEAMVQAIDTHKIRPPIDRRFRFEDAKDAYQVQSSPELFGKIVIDLA